MEQLATRFSRYMVDNGAIPEEKQDLFRYGFETLASAVVKGLILLGIGIGLGRLPEMLIFMVFFPSLRVYCGGHHAETFTGCIVVTVFTALATVFCGVWAVQLGVHEAAIPVAMAAAVFCVYRFAPREHVNNPFGEEKAKVYRTKARRIVTADALLVALLLYLGLCPLYTTVMAFSVFATAAYVIPMKHIAK